MAKYRHVHTEFWQDPKVLEEMTPEDRYFYLYLLTNPNTSQIGIYSITKKQMAFDLGYSIESINSLMERFLKHHKLVEFNPTTREIAIIKWGKYNLTKAGKPMLDCIQKELRQVKDRSLIQLIYPHIPNESIKQLFLRYVNDTSTTSDQKEKEKEKEKENNILSGKPDEASSEKDEIPYKLIIDLLNKVAGTKYR
ncbi:DNA replication protein DnaD, partial [Bacillus paralicheniformis]|uniref:DNA replication protein DnaD n=1 Tax=Bacillus paralicheniformis TaxID=1648923 RepID=UPI0016491A1D